MSTHKITLSLGQKIKEQAIMEGWNENEMPSIMTAIGNIESLAYELRNCQRGCYTGCYTYDELKETIREYGQALVDAADECDYVQDEEMEDEDDDQ